MSISKKEVEQIAALSRLSFSESELKSLTGDLDSILGHIEELAAADVEGVDPMRGVSDHTAPMRSDEAGADALRRSPSEIAPEWTEGFFVVPRLAALDGDAVAEEVSS